MLGKILGVNISNESGTIIGEDENRYTFIKQSLKDNIIPQKNMCIEFRVLENNKATDITTCDVCFQEKNNLKFGISTIFLTLIFGCIGTFVSRYLFAKLPLKKVWLPTLLHFCISIVLFVPLLGIIFYIVGVLYFTVKNYKIVMKQ